MKCTVPKNGYQRPEPRAKCDSVNSKLEVVGWHCSGHAIGAILYDFYSALPRDIEKLDLLF